MFMDPRQYLQQMMRGGGLAPGGGPAAQNILSAPAPGATPPSLPGIGAVMPQMKQQIGMQNAGAAGKGAMAAGMPPANPEQMQQILSQLKPQMQGGMQGGLQGLVQGGQLPGNLMEMLKGYM